MDGRTYKLWLMAGIPRGTVSVCSWSLSKTMHIICMQQAITYSATNGWLMLRRRCATQASNARRTNEYIYEMASDRSTTFCDLDFDDARRRWFTSRCLSAGHKDHRPSHYLRSQDPGYFTWLYYIIHISKHTSFLPSVCSRFTVLMFHVQSSIELPYAINHSFIHS